MVTGVIYQRFGWQDPPAETSPSLKVLCMLCFPEEREISGDRHMATQEVASTESSGDTPCTGNQASDTTAAGCGAGALDSLELLSPVIDAKPPQGDPQHLLMPCLPSEEQLACDPSLLSGDDCPDGSVNGSNHMCPFLKPSVAKAKVS